MVALRELLDAYPARGDDDLFHRIHTRLSREPTRAVLARYFEHVTDCAIEEERGAVEEGDTGSSSRMSEIWDESPWSNVFRAWVNIARARASTKPPSPMRVDLLNSGTPEQALEAFLRIPEGQLPSQGSEEEALILAGINHWIRGCDDTPEAKALRRPKDCSCGAVKIHPFRPDEHIARCPHHPAWLRVARLQSALRFGGVANPPGPDLTELFAKPGRGQEPVWLTERSDAQDAVEAWRRGKTHTGGDRQPPRVVRAVLLEAVRLARPEAVPCPFCRTVVGLSGLAPHLWTCDAHPAAVALRELQEAFDARAAEGADVALARAKEYQTLRQTLRELVDACEKFSSDQGWNGERAYSKEWCERPWLAALDRAEEVAGPRREVPTNINAATARLTATLIELLASCRTYWSRADDGSNRSLMDPEQDKIWRRDIQMAQDLLVDPTCTET